MENIVILSPDGTKKRQQRNIERALGL